jgi:hypothetical protein
MDYIVFQNQIKVSVTKSPEIPSEGDTVIFSANASLLNAENFDIDNYLFEYTWMVSENEGVSFYKIGDNSNTLIINDISKNFDNSIYKVKVILQDLDGFLLTENGDRLISQVGELFLTNNNIGGLNVQISAVPNDTNVSDDIVTKTNGLSNLDFTNLNSFISEAEIYDDTIDDDTKAAILSGQSTIDNGSQNVSGESKVTVDLPNTPDPDFVLPTETQNLNDIYQQGIFTTDRYKKQNKNISLAGTTVTWDECYPVFNFLSNPNAGGYNSVYASLEDCVASNSCAPPIDNCINHNGLVLTEIHNTIWYDEEGVKKSACCPYLVTDCPGGLAATSGCFTGSTNQGLAVNKGSAGKIPMNDFVNKYREKEENKNTPCSESVRNDAGSKLLEITPDFISKPETRHQATHGTNYVISYPVTPDSTTNAMSIGNPLLHGVGIFPCCGGRMMAGVPYTKQGQVFWGCSYTYYNRHDSCGGIPIKLPSQDYYTARDGRTNEKLKYPVKYNPEVTYNCDNGGSLDIFYSSDDCKYYITKECCPKGSSCYCTVNEASVPKDMKGAPIAIFPPHTIRRIDQGVTKAYSIDRSGMRDCIVTDNSKCNAKCDGEYCCDELKYIWSVERNGTQKIKCNSPANVSDKHYYSIGSLRVKESNGDRYENAKIQRSASPQYAKVNYEVSVCNPDSNKSYTVSKYKVIQKFKKKSDLDMDGYTSKETAIAAATSAIKKSGYPGIIFSYSMQRSDEFEQDIDILSAAHYTLNGKVYIPVIRAQYKYVGEATPVNLCGGFCDIWYKVSKPQKIDYPCDDSNFSVCDENHPGNCNKVGSDKTTPIKVVYVTQVTDEDETLAAEADLIANGTDSDYRRTVSAAISLGRSRVGSTGMVCSGNDPVNLDPPDDPLSPADPDIDQNIGSPPDIDIDIGDIDIGGGNDDGNNNVGGGGGSVGGPGGGGDDSPGGGGDDSPGGGGDMGGSPPDNGSGSGSFRSNNGITMIKGDNGAITTSPPNAPPVPFYSNGQYVFDQYGNAYFMAPLGAGFFARPNANITVAELFRRTAVWIQ